MSTSAYYDDYTIKTRPWTPGSEEVRLIREEVTLIRAGLPGEMTLMDVVELGQLHRYAHRVTSSVERSLEKDLLRLGYTFDPGFRNLQRRSSGPTTAEWMGESPVFGTLVSVDRSRGVATFEKRHPNGGSPTQTTVDYSMLAEVSTALVKASAITADAVAHLAISLGAHPTRPPAIVNPSPDAALAVILDDIRGRHGAERNDKGVEWLTSITNSIIEILKEEESGEL